MKLIKLTVLVASASLLSGCLDKQDKTVDRFLDSDPDLASMRAGIWVDPNGCDHWIIDDGVEGYLSQRLDQYGKPVCSGAAPPGYAVGDFKGGGTSIIGDPI